MPLRRALLAFITLTSLLFLAEPAAGFEPREDPVAEAGWGACGMSTDGRFVVFPEDGGTGWARWSAGTGVQSVGGSVDFAAEVSVSDDGRFVTQWFDDITGDRVSQLDTATGVTRDLSGFQSTTRPAVDPAGAVVAWFEIRTAPSGIGAPSFVGVRLWNRATGVTSTVLDVTASGWDESGATAVSANGRFLSLGLSPSTTSVRVFDVDRRAVRSVTRPGGRETTTLHGISDDGSRYFWVDWTDRSSDRWIVADGAGRTIGEVSLGFTMFFDGAVFMRGEYFLSADGSEVLGIGARSGQPNPRENGEGYRWTVGGALESIETSALGSGYEGTSPSLERTSTWCDADASARYVVVRELQDDGGTILRRADLDRVAPRSVVVADVTGSQLSDQVTRLYTAFFGRAPDAGGLQHWMRQRAGGMSVAAVADQFARSDEFVQTYGVLDAEAFVDLVYDNVLGRSPDADGRAYWLGQLAAGRSRGSMMTGFSESPEYVESTGTSTPVFDRRAASISRVYRAFFGRPGDDGGLTHWFDEITSGRADLGSVATSFTRSAEFVETYGALDDAAFVDLVYRNVLERDPDAAGRAYWIGQLGSGRSRGSMMIGFSESPEYVVATDTIPPTS